MAATVTAAEPVKPSSRRAVRIERCACGGHIAALRDDWGDAFEAITEHNETPEHRAWRDAREAA